MSSRNLLVLFLVLSVVLSLTMAAVRLNQYGHGEGEDFIEPLTQRRFKRSFGFGYGGLGGLGGFGGFGGGFGGWGWGR